MSPADPAVEAFIQHFASLTDANARKRLLASVQMRAVKGAPEEAFLPNVRSLRAYLDSPIITPPSLVWPTIAVRGEITTTLGRAGKGKCSPLDSKILTPTGWTTMGEIQVGDRVSNPVTGRASNVVGVYPQGERAIYKVTLTDGAQLEVGAEHRWEVTPRGGTEAKVMTTRELIDAGVRAGGNRRRFALPSIEPIEFDEALLPISPYALGALIGDGSLSSGKDIRFTSNDPELAEKLSVELRCPVVKRASKFDYGVNQSAHILADLSSMGLCVTSESKFVPETYLRASVASRIELLRGLMDTDGCANGEFCSKSKQLVSDVVEIVRSLGGRASLSPKSTSWTHKEVKHYGTAWRTRIKLPKGINPFWLPRKADQWTNSEYLPTRFIDRIDYVGIKEAQCIMVDHHRHLYVGDDYVVTMNTTMNLNRIFAWAAGRPLFPGWADKDGQEYLKPDKPLKTLIAENEGNAGMFHQKVGLLIHQGPLKGDDRELALDNIFIHGDGGYSGLKLDNDEGIKKLRKSVEACTPDIVFIEPFRSLWSGEENSSTDMAKVVDNIVAMATDYGCAVILSHHERKSGAGDDGEKMSAGRGSTVLEGVVAVMENFESVKEGEYREMSWSKARYLPAPAPVRMGWNPDTGWYDWVPQDALDDQIIMTLRESADEPMSVKDLSEATGETQSRLRPRLKLMETDKKIKKMASTSTANGSTGFRYRLPSSDNTGGLAI